jgi:hypothetical protein
LSTVHIKEEGAKLSLYLHSLFQDGTTHLSGASQCDWRYQKHTQQLSVLGWNLSRVPSELRRRKSTAAGWFIISRHPYRSYLRLGWLGVCARLPYPPVFWRGCQWHTEQLEWACPSCIQRFSVLSRRLGCCVYHQRLFEESRYVKDWQVRNWPPVIVSCKIFIQPLAKPDSDCPILIRV